MRTLTALSRVWWARCCDNGRPWTRRVTGWWKCRTNSLADSVVTIPVTAVVARVRRALRSVISCGLSRVLLNVVKSLTS